MKLRCVHCDKGFEQKSEYTVHFIEAVCGGCDMRLKKEMNIKVEDLYKLVLARQYGDAKLKAVELIELIDKELED